MKIEACSSCGGWGTIRIQDPRAAIIGPLCPECGGTGEAKELPPDERTRKQKIADA